MTNVRVRVHDEPELVEIARWRAISAGRYKSTQFDKAIGAMSKPVLYEFLRHYHSAAAAYAASAVIKHGTYHFDWAQVDFDYVAFGALRIKVHCYLEEAAPEIIIPAQGECPWNWLVVMRLLKSPGRHGDPWKDPSLDYIYECLGFVPCWAAYERVLRPSDVLYEADPLKCEGEPSKHELMYDLWPHYRLIGFKWHADRLGSVELFHERLAEIGQQS